MQEKDEFEYNNIIYCYVEEQKGDLEKFIEKYNDESVIHIISSVIESCEGKMLYCLRDIITNYIETDGKPGTRFYFATDVKELYNIVKKFYFAIFEEIIYLKQDNNKRFSEGFDTYDFILYFLDVQRNKMHSSFMRRLWNLKECKDKNSFMKFLYELKRIGIEQEDYKRKIWCCFCEILLYEAGQLSYKDNYFYYKLSIYSILMALSKNADYTYKYLVEILENNEISAQNMYFIWNQLKSLSFRKCIIFNEQSKLLHDKLYEKAYNEFWDNQKEFLTRLPQKRNKEVVIVLTIQFLDETHAPTRTVIERVKTLIELGKEVILVNTIEQGNKQGYVPIYNVLVGSFFEEYNNFNKIEIGGKVMPFFQMQDNSPMEYRIQFLRNIIKKYKPYYILSIGTGSMLADLCGNIIPCVSMSLVFSTLPKTKNKMKILGRKLTEEERELYSNEDIDIIESRFTFELKPQKGEFLRREKGLPEDRFLLVVVGIRLGFEIDNNFMDMLSKVCKAGCYVAFAGIMDNYNNLMEEYPIVSANSSFIGCCDDILALMEICDLYVNPDRLGGGFSIIEAFSKGVPGVYLKSGDVYTAGGEDFAVGSFDEMMEQVLKYKNDKEYYNKMSKLARERAELMTSSKEAIEDIDRQICQRIEEKYW